MKQYYKIVDGYPVVASVQVESDFIEYEVGAEPKELADAIQATEVKEKEQVFRAERNRILSALDKPLWINSLTKAQKSELDVYYKALLDSTVTMELPAMPEFCKQIVGV